MLPVILPGGEQGKRYLRGIFWKYFPYRENSESSNQLQNRVMENHLPEKTLGKTSPRGSHFRAGESTLVLHVCFQQQRQEESGWKFISPAVKLDYLPIQNTHHRRLPQQTARCFWTRMRKTCHSRDPRGTCCRSAGSADPAAPRVPPPRACTWALPGLWPAPWQPAKKNKISPDVFKDGDGLIAGQGGMVLNW